jgi:hypothetical protein
MDSRDEDRSVAWYIEGTSTARTQAAPGEFQEPKTITAPRRRRRPDIFEATSIL